MYSSQKAKHIQLLQILQVRTNSTPTNENLAFIPCKFPRQDSRYTRTIQQQPPCKNAETQGEGFGIWLANKPHLHWKQQHKSDEEEKFAHNVASTNLFPTITSLLWTKERNRRTKNG